MDASALLAVFLSEPHAPAVKAAIASAGTMLMSSVTLTECCLVLIRRAGFTATRARQEIEALRIEVVQVGTDQAVVAAEARHRYSIRFGDAFVYALAKERNLPILTLDAEFAKTDADLVPLEP